MTSHVYCSSSYSEPIVDKIVGDLKWIKVSKTLTKKVKIIMNKSSAELERMLGGDGENFMVASKKTIFSKFPCMSAVCNKNFSGAIFNMARKLGCPVSFVPPTYILPDDLKQVQKVFGEHQDGKSAKKSRRRHRSTYIVKPVDGAQGDGIFLAQSFRDIEINLCHNQSKKVVVQKYISSPMTIEGKKFDLRIYVLIRQFLPKLEIYLCEEGLVRLCSEKYTKPSDKNLKNLYSHLTNYSLNKHSENFDHNDDVDKGSKRSLTSFYEYLEQEGIDADQLRIKLKTVAYNTGQAIRPYIIHSCNKLFSACANGRSFQILGLDVLIETKMSGSFDVHLLEINSNPSVSIDDIVRPEKLTTLEREIQPSKKFWVSGVGLPCDCRNGAKGHLHRISRVDLEVKKQVIGGAFAIISNKVNAQDSFYGLSYSRIEGIKEHPGFEILNALRTKYEDLIGFSTRGKNFSWKPLSDFQFRRYAKDCLVGENFSLLDASIIFSKAKEKHGSVDLFAFLDMVIYDILPRVIKADVSDKKNAHLIFKNLGLQGSK